MKLTGELEKKVNEAADKAEAKKLIEQTGMLLTDDELNQAAGGGFSLSDLCPKGGSHDWTDDPAVFKHFNTASVSWYQICKKCGSLGFSLDNPIAGL